jgi:disulfide bond formation protein DsbB
LCILQRVAFLSLAVVFLIAAVHGPGRGAGVFYSSVLFIIAAAGAVIAARHVWLQHLPQNQIPECGPGLEYMLSKLPLTQVLEKIFKGSGECAEVGWTLLGLSIAEWSLLWFVLLGGFAVWLAVIGARGAGHAVDRHAG